MADNYQPTSKPIAQTADPQRVFPDGTPGIISFGPYTILATLRRLERAGRLVPSGDREFAGDGEGNCPLWDGHIIDATFPLV
jgi:hypothetical protein